MYNVIIFTDSTDNILTMMPLGPYKIGHVLRKHGYSCLVINHLSDFTLEELQEIIDLTVTNDTYLVGFGTTFLRSVEVERNEHEPTPAYPDMPANTVFPQGKEFENEFFKHLKNKNPKIKSVVGGTRATIDYANKNIDYACVGFSEISAVNLVNHLIKGEALRNNSKNIWGRIVIDDRFAKDYKFQEEDMRWEPTDVVNHQFLPIEIGRGCVFKCKFCDYPMTGKKVLDFVKHEEILKQELEDTYKKYGIRHYTIVDDTFNDHPQKLESIRRVVKQLSFQPIFWAFLRLDLLHIRPETIPIIYDIGIRAMFFGIETLNPATGKAIGKGHDRNKQIETIKHIAKTYPDVSMHGSFIVGLPYESVESCTTTSEMLNSQEIPLSSWNFYPLYLFNPKQFAFNSELSLKFPEYGYEDLGTPDSNLTINWKNEHMTHEDAKRLANEFIDESRKNDHFKLTGLVSYHLLNLGYEFDQSKTTAWKDVDWFTFEKKDRPRFIDGYKTKLLDLIKSKNRLT